MNRHDLTDKQWERLQGLLPPQKPPTGRPNLGHRIVINGILWIARTGAPWRDLPESYFSTKVHIRAERGGKPMTFVLTPGQRHESTVFERLLEQGEVKRLGPGRPKRRPRRVATRYEKRAANYLAMLTVVAILL